jgi:hypothetical protein
MGGVLEITVVIAGADYSVFERLPSEPAIKGQKILRIIPRIHEITGMHQNISVRETLYPVVECVGV